MISDTAVSVSGKITETATQVKTDIEKKQDERKVVAAERKREDDLKKLCPIFDEDLTPENLRYERIVRIVKYDPRLENEVCRGSFGFYELAKSIKIPTIYRKYIDKLNLVFYPQLCESVFIQDPCIDGKYIEADEFSSI